MMSMSQVKKFYRKTAAITDFVVFYKAMSGFVSMPSD